jgi:hypothetical protein
MTLFEKIEKELNQHGVEVQVDMRRGSRSISWWVGDCQVASYGASTKTPADAHLLKMLAYQASILPVQMQTR